MGSKYTFQRSALILAICAFALISKAMADCITHPLQCTTVPDPAPKHPPETEVVLQGGIDLSVPKVTGGLIEHSQVTITYTARVDRGPGGASPLTDVIVCSGDGSPTNICDLYGQVKPPWSSPLNKAITIRVPDAGPNVPIRLTLCKRGFDIASGTIICGDVLATNEVTVPVAARYTISLDSFTILSTRSRSSDTVYLALAGMFNGQPWGPNEVCAMDIGQPSANRKIACKGPLRFGTGDFGHGTQKVGNFVVGEFVIVPQDVGSLTFGYVAFNYGFPLQSNEITGSMVGNVQGSLTSWVHNANEDNIANSDFTNELNGPPWFGCDGPTAAGAEKIQNRGDKDTLDMLTKAGNGVFAGQSKIFQVTSQVGCGDSGRYQINWSVRRTSW